MIRCPPRQLAANDVSMAHGHAAAAERLIQGHHCHESGERAEVRRRRSDVVEGMLCECVVGELIAPVVAIAYDNRGQMGGLTEQMMRQDVTYLPMPFAFAKT